MTTAVQIGPLLQDMLDRLDDPAPPGAEECPVCNEYMLTECMMSKCMHRWCQDCHNRMRKLNPGSLKCPLCNTALKAADATLVALRERPEQPSVDDEAALMQSFGTKIGAVVKCVKDTLAGKPADKVRLRRLQSPFCCPPRALHQWPEVMCSCAVRCGGRGWRWWGAHACMCLHNQSCSPKRTLQGAAPPREPEWLGCSSSCVARSHGAISLLHLLGCRAC